MIKKLLTLTLLSSLLFAVEKEPQKIQYSADFVPAKMSVKEKKKRYFALLVPSTKKVYNELLEEYKEVAASLNQPQMQTRIAQLKSRYSVTSDKDLLLAMKPHPVSIPLAQGAMESAWGTSRFFTEANNVFGMWSSNKNQKRVAASVKRGGTRTIWLRKFDSIEESVRAYYLTIARAKAYKKLRQIRYESDDVYEIIKGLDKYSEIGEKYVEEIGSVIRYNKLTKYD